MSLRNAIPFLLCLALTLAACGDGTMSASDAETHAWDGGDAPAPVAHLPLRRPPAPPLIRAAPEPMAATTTPVVRPSPPVWQADLAPLRIAATRSERALRAAAHGVARAATVAEGPVRRLLAGRWARAHRYVLFCGHALPHDAVEVACSEYYPDHAAGETIDLGVLARLPNLRRLTMTSVEGVRWHSLAELRSLEELSLKLWAWGAGEAWTTGMPDMATIARLPRLQRLEVSLGPDEALVEELDLTPLRRLRSLRSLVVDVERWTQESDDEAPRTRLVGLDRLRRLESLRLRGVALPGRGALRAPRLRTLSLRTVAGIDPLRAALAYPRLRKLSLDRVQNADLRRLARALRRLERLDLTDSPLTDISPLTRLRRLRGLDLTRVPVADFAPLAQLRGLRELGLGGTPIAHLGVVASLASLERLNVSSLELQSLDLAPLAALAELRDLRAQWTPVTGLDALGAVPLARLDVNASGLTGLAVLAGLADTLVELRVGGNNIDDLRPLTRFARLATLDISRSAATELGSTTDLAPLRALPSLERLRMTGERFEGCSFPDEPFGRTPDRGGCSLIDVLQSRGVSVAYEPERGC